MSILDSTPKSSVRFLVGRREELLEVVRSVQEHRITVVLGPRRIGKSSLVKTALVVLSGKEKLENIRLSARFIPVYVDMWAIVATSRSSRLFFEHLNNAILRSLEDHDKTLADKYKTRMYKVEELYARESSIEKIIKIGTKREQLYKYPVDILRCVDEFNDVLTKHNRKAVLAVDEAQELGTLKPFIPTAWLAHIHDHATNMHILLSGSYVGLFKKILHPKPKDPLYGRDIRKINIGKLKPEALLTIFFEGLNERGVQPSPEIYGIVLKAVDILKPAIFAQQIPFSNKSAQISIGAIITSKEAKRELEKKPLEARTSPEYMINLVETLIHVMSMTVLSLLQSMLVYYSANLLMKIGFDINRFSITLPKETEKNISRFAELITDPEFRIILILSLFVLSGSPSLMISLAKNLPNRFTDEHLLETGLHVLDESYKAVCNEINRFIESYSKKPEIIVDILYTLYSAPRTWSEIVQALSSQDVDKKSISENLKTLIELGYLEKFKEGAHIYYYITDPLLFYALKEKCIGILKV
ncbi:MAG: ATP-binding protein [Thermoprotei archaeon]